MPLPENVMGRDLRSASGRTRGQNVLSSLGVHRHVLHGGSPKQASHTASPGLYCRCQAFGWYMTGAACAPARPDSSGTTSMVEARVSRRVAPLAAAAAAAAFSSSMVEEAPPDLEVVVVVADDDDDDS